MMEYYNMKVMALIIEHSGKSRNIVEYNGTYNHQCDVVKQRIAPLVL